MSEVVDVLGQTFGRLTVIERAGVNRRRQITWRCQCACGTVVVAPSLPLRDGRTRSCGCLQRELQSARARTHGASKTPEYRAWKGMLTRCTNPRRAQWKDYGGRGIRVCERWAESFEAFLSDVGPKPHPKAELDRRDNDGNYEPGNVRWTSKDEQSVNKRTTRFVTFRGQLMSLRDAARHAGVNYYTAHWRLRRGATEAEALRAP